MRPTSKEAAISLLELTASESPQLLPWAVQVLRSSGAGLALAKIATDWGADVEILAPVVLKAVADLDTLIRCRKLWRRPEQVLRLPNAKAIADLATAHHTRMFTAPAWRRNTIERRSKLQRIAARCSSAHRADSTIRWMLNFLQLPEGHAEPVSGRKLGGQGVSASRRCGV